MCSAVIQPDPAPISAVTISRDVSNFELLIEDMEACQGENWGDLGFADALAFFEQPDAEALEFIAIAMDGDDARHASLVGDIIEAAKAKDVKVILIAEDLSPSLLHQLLRQGADEFVPYPLPEGELAAAIGRLNEPAPEPVAAQPAPQQPPLKATGDKNGVVLAFHGLSGGTGTTTLAVNMAWELANIEKKNNPSVCILDLDLQFGSVSTYLDLPRREAVYELLSDTESMDNESFMQVLLPYNEKLQVMTAPFDLLPLDIIGPEDIERIIEIAQSNFDYVVVDMPSTLVSWTETVLTNAHVYFATVELDMRSAQNAMRLKKALQAEELPFEKLRFILNRAPKFTDLNGKSRIKRMAESLGITIDVLMPDGGKPVAQADDHGLPLAESAAKNPLRKEIVKLAKSVHDINKAEETGS